MLGDLSGWSHATLLSLFLLTSGAFPQEAKRAEPLISQWESLVPAIANVLPRPCSDPEWEIRILDAAAIPGGSSIAIVDYCDGLPSTDWIVVMQLETGRPALAHFRDERKRSLHPDFLQAASVTEFADVRIAPDRTTVLDFRQENDDHGVPVKCQVRAYVWNAATKTFDYNARRSRQATHAECGN